MVMRLALLTHKYLGIIVDNKLNWKENSHSVYKKAQSRLYFLSKLRYFHLCDKMLRLFYSSVVGIVVTYAIVCWNENLAMEDCHDVGLGDRFMTVINTTSPLFPLSTLLMLHLQKPWLT